MNPSVSSFLQSAPHSSLEVGPFRLRGPQERSRSDHISVLTELCVAMSRLGTRGRTVQVSVLLILHPREPPFHPFRGSHPERTSTHALTPSSTTPWWRRRSTSLPTQCSWEPPECVRLCGHTLHRVEAPETRRPQIRFSRNGDYAGIFGPNRADCPLPYQ